MRVTSEIGKFGFKRLDALMAPGDLTFRQILEKQLVRDLGFHHFPLFPMVLIQPDITIGIGRNLSKNGLSNEEIRLLFNNDLDVTYKLIIQFFLWAREMETPRLAVLINLCFSLGVDTLQNYVEFLEFCRLKNYDDAALELRKIPLLHYDRLERLAVQLAEGRWVD